VSLQLGSGKSSSSPPHVVTAFASLTRYIFLEHKFDCSLWDLYAMLAMLVISKPPAVTLYTLAAALLPQRLASTRAYML
jgi:hypothetical protein